MTAKFFIDTNILVYAASEAVADQARRDLSLELLDRSDLALSAQVLAEFYSVATSKTKLNMPHKDAVVLLQSLDRIPACPISRELVMEAVDIRQRFQISYWDAAIVVAAKAHGLHNHLQRRPERGAGLRRRDSRQPICRRRIAIGRAYDRLGSDWMIMPLVTVPA